MGCHDVCAAIGAIPLTCPALRVLHGQVSALKFRILTHFMRLGYSVFLSGKLGCKMLG